MVRPAEEDPEVLPPPRQEDDPQHARDEGADVAFLKTGWMSLKSSEVATRMKRTTSCMIVIARRSS